MADDSRPDPELLRLCFISGQMPESAWIEHVRRGDVEDEMTEDLMTSQRHPMTTPDKDFEAAVEIARREEREACAQYLEGSWFEDGGRGRAFARSIRSGEHLKTTTGGAAQERTAS